MRTIQRLLLLLLALAVVATPLCSCDLLTSFQTAIETANSISIKGEEEVTLTVGETVQLELNLPSEVLEDVIWTSSEDCVTVDPSGLVTAVAPGASVVTATFGTREDSVLIVVAEENTTTPPNDSDNTEQTTPEATTPESIPEETTPSTPDTPTDPEDYASKYANMTRAEFYTDYQPAENAEDAYWRSQYGFMSGTLVVPDQAPTLAENRPMQDGKYIRNSVTTFIDSNTYVLVDVNGEVVMEIYRGGGYITLEEVAAYVYAFGDIPANYSSNKKASPKSSIWGQYLRVNNTKFSGDTRKYPYEPELPRISGCGGDLTYYEIDIGTMGTDCDPSYAATIYNNGTRIDRGAARIVYARYDRDGNMIIDPNERYLFYTYNHYNDFQEYLNYYGGWGEMFGNITGGGQISSKYNCNPTPYVEVVCAPLPSLSSAFVENEVVEIVYFFCPIIDTKTRAA